VINVRNLFYSDKHFLIRMEPFCYPFKTRSITNPGLGSFKTHKTMSLNTYKPHLWLISDPVKSSTQLNL
jgi:hypothetical protein